MKQLLSSSRRRLLFLAAGLIAVIGLALVVWSNFFIKKIEATPWFDDRWQYRQTVPVTWNGSGTSNSQMFFTFSTSTLVSNAKLQSDCDDLRFTDPAGKALDYFLEKGCNTTTTLIWVNMSTLSSIPTYLYVYYGNAAVAAGSKYNNNVPWGVGTGDGADGNCTFSANTNINTGTCVAGGIDADITSSTTDTSQNATAIVVSATTGLAVGDEILIINQQGTTTNNADVGKYETARITAINGTTLSLNHPLANRYDGTTQKITVQRVPNYGTVTVNTGVTVNATAWGGTRGGIVMFRATGTVTLNGTAVITATSLGYAGGAAGTLTEVGGNTGESYDGPSSGRGGNGSSGGESRGGGRAGNGAAGSNPGGAADGAVTGAGGGGGSAGSADGATGGGGGGGGGGYAGGGGGGGSNGDDPTPPGATGGAGGVGGDAGTAGGGGGGSCLDTSGAASTGRAGGAASAAGAGGSGCGSGTGGGGSVGSEAVQGAGGGGTASTDGSGAGGGGGGFYGDAPLKGLFLGSGAGGGGASDDGVAGTDGGAGGGIIYIGANTLTMNLTATIVASGSASTTPSTKGGAGGGGAGGSIIFNIATLTQIGETGGQKVAAKGGTKVEAGSHVAGGGGGGDGRVHFSYSTITLSNDSNPTSDRAIVPVAGAAAGEEKGPGPVGYWKLDEGVGTSLNSSVSTPSATLNGLVNNPTWQTEDLCVAGKCLYFEGSNATASAATTTFLGLQSVAFWAKPASSSGTIPFISFSSGTGEVAISSSNLAVTTAGISSPTVYVNGVVTSTLVANKWNHIEVTTASGFNAINPVLGKVHLTYFKGFMDEVKFYAYARTAAQVRSDAIKGAAAKGSTAVFANNQNLDALNQGMVGYWKMDESIWTRDCSTLTATDSAQLNPAKSCPSTTGPTTSPTAANKQAKFGNAGDLDGSNDYLEVPDSNSLDVTNITLSAWIRATSLGGTVIQKSTTAGTDGYSMDTSGSKIRYCGSGGCASSTTTLTASVWQHVAVTVDSSGTKFYLNGVADGTSTANNSVPTNALVLRMGADSAGATLFTGQMDEARVYNRALSPAEIAQLYNFAPGPLGYWKMEEKQGTTTYDSSGNAFNGTMTGFTADVGTTGKFGTAGNFAGGQFSQFGTNKFANEFNYTRGTLMAWARVSSVADWTDAASRKIVNIRLDASNQVLLQKDSTSNRVKLDFQGAAANCNSNALSSAVFTTTDWFHLAITWDTVTPTVVTYINGVVEPLDTNNIVSASCTWASLVNTEVGIGARNTSFTNPWNGAIDEVRVYNYPRTPGQIVADMNGGNPLGGSPVGTAADWWKFEAATGLVASSSGTQRTAGTLTSMAVPTASVGVSGWQKAGKFGGGVAVDGINDYVSFGDLSYLENVGTMSASLWVNPNALATQRCILCKWQNTAEATKESWAIETGSSDSSTVMVEISNDGNNTQATATTPTGKLAVGTWTHVAVVYDASGLTNADKLKIFINGVKQTLTFTGTVPDFLQATTSNLRMGASSDGTAARLFSGQLDEVKIYFGALSQAEVLVDYNRNSGVVLGSFGTSGATTASHSASATYCVPGDTSTCNPPVGEWNFEEGAGATAYDTSSNGNTGTITAGTGGFVAGRLGKAYNFDGASTVVNAGTATTLDNLPASGITLKAWIYPTSMGEGSAGFIMAKNVGTTPSAGWLFGLTGTNALTFTVDGSTDVVRTTNSNAVTLNAWNHAAVSWDGVMTTASSIHIYVNGVEQGYATSTNGASRVDDGTSTFYVGNDSTSARTFSGRIDQARVFNYARTPAQVAWDYNRGLPVTWWKADECSGSTLNNSVGTVSGTLTLGPSGQTGVGDCVTSANTPWYDGRSGKYNSSVDLDGTDDYVVTGNANLLAFEGQTTTKASWGVWVNPASSVASKTIMFKKNEFRITTDGSSLPACQTYDGAWTSAAAASALSLSTWSHILCTYDGTNVKIYVNGVLAGSAAETGNITAWAWPLNVGRDADNNNQFFQGLIDEVKVWNYDLTSYQVKVEYNQGSAIRFGPASGAP